MTWHNEQNWKTYRDQELENVTPILKRIGYTLEEKQPHIQGERFLMQAVTTTHSQKLILIGRRTTDNLRVVIKISPNKNDADEIRHERICRRALERIEFAYTTFAHPQELFFGEQDGYVIFIQEFIEQPCQFLDRPHTEQFELALRAFKAQEGVRATTYAHHRFIKKIFGKKECRDYIHLFSQFKEGIQKKTPKNTHLLTALEQSQKEIEKHGTYIDQYADFLTHTDFVPHNFRIRDKTIYLLDHSSIRFGNKHEGWARFLNFMTLYNPTLEHAFTQYTKDNRAPEEAVSLRLMRLYRLGEILLYYTNTLSRSEGNLRILNEKRVELWATVLSSLLHETPLPQDTIETYKNERDALRSEEEKERQIGLH